MAHPAFADLRGDFVDAKASAWSESQTDGSIAVSVARTRSLLCNGEVFRNRSPARQEAPFRQIGRHYATRQDWSGSLETLAPQPRHEICRRRDITNGVDARPGPERQFARQPSCGFGDDLQRPDNRVDRFPVRFEIGIRKTRSKCLHQVDILEDVPQSLRGSLNP